MILDKCFHIMSNKSKRASAILFHRSFDHLNSYEGKFLVLLKYC